MNVAAIKSRRMRRRGRVRERQKRQDRRPILKNLCATLLRSFRGQHDKKMVCARGVPGVTGTSGKPTAISTQPKRGRDRTTTLRRLLIGAG